jgi:hypothetical protein
MKDEHAKHKHLRTAICVDAAGLVTEFGNRFSSSEIVCTHPSRTRHSDALRTTTAVTLNLSDIYTFDIRCKNENSKLQEKGSGGSAQLVRKTHSSERSISSSDVDWMQTPGTHPIEYLSFFDIDTL